MIRAAPCSFALQALVGVAAIVADDQDAHAIAQDPIEEVIGEAFEVGPPEVGFEEMVSVRPPRGA